MPTVDLSDALTPVPVTNGNTTITVASRSGSCATYQLVEFTFDEGVAYGYTDRPGCERTDIQNRISKGTLKVTAEPLTSYDYFAKAKDDEPFAIAISHGTASGNIVKFDAAKAQLTDLDYGDVDGILTYEMNLEFVKTNGNDEWKWTFM